MLTQTSTSKWVADRQFLNHCSDGEHRQRLLELNDLLEKDAGYNRISETLLEKRLDELEGIGSMQSVECGLILARINELALICAGNYADHGEVQAVGDLLFNPRRILIYITGISDPVVKERHMALTEQFAHVALTKAAIIDWLRDHTIVEIQKEALLPHLYERLSETRFVSIGYLDSVRERTIKAANLTGFLGSRNLPDGMDLHQWLLYARSGDRRLIESMLCQFSQTIFFELGEDVRQALRRSIRREVLDPLISRKA